MATSTLSSTASATDVQTNQFGETYPKQGPLWSNAEREGMQAQLLELSPSYRKLVNDLKAAA